MCKNLPNSLLLELKARETLKNSQQSAAAAERLREQNKETARGILLNIQLQLARKTK